MLNFFTKLEKLYTDEVWEDIIEYKGSLKINRYTGLYKISNYGRLWSFRSNKLLSLFRNSNGYITVTLTDDNSNSNKQYVHRLVAQTFIPNSNNNSEVHHIDGDKSNNHVKNLQWINRSHHAWITFDSKVTKLQIEHKNTPVIQCDMSSNPIKIFNTVEEYFYDDTGKIFYGYQIHACCGGILPSKITYHYYNGYVWYYIYDYRRIFPSRNIEL